MLNFPYYFLRLYKILYQIKLLWMIRIIIKWITKNLRI